MSPVYSNFFVVRKNEANTEVIIDMLHNYSEVVTKVNEENKQNLITELSLKSDNVGSFVLNMNDAIGLRDVLNSVIFDTQSKK